MSPSGTSSRIMARRRRRSAEGGGRGAHDVRQDSPGIGASAQGFVRGCPRCSRPPYAKIACMSLAIAQLDPDGRRSSPPTRAAFWTRLRRAVRAGASLVVPRNFRCAAIRRRTWYCARRSWTLARANSRHWRRRSPQACWWWASRSGMTDSATTRWRSFAVAVWSRSIASAASRITRFSTSSAISRRATRPACSTSMACASASSSAKTSGFRTRRRARRAGAELLVVQRIALSHAPAGAAPRSRCRARRRDRMPIVYVNRVGGQDELVFDGASFVARRERRVAQQLPAWHETVAIVEFDGAVPRHVRGELDPRLEAHVYEALVMGVRDYVEKNGFPGRAARTFGRHRFGVDARGRGRRSRARPGPRGHAAVGLQRRDQSRGCAHDGRHARRALRRNPIEPVFCSVSRGARAGIPRPAPKTPPKRTFRRAFAAHC